MAASHARGYLLTREMALRVFRKERRGAKFDPKTGRPPAARQTRVRESETVGGAGAKSDEAVRRKVKISMDEKPKTAEDKKRE